jgi:hypothetical protein
MSAVVEAPLEMVEAVAALRLPPRDDRRLQLLMDGNNNGELTSDLRSVPTSVNDARSHFLFWLLVVDRDDVGL